MASLPTATAKAVRSQLPAASPRDPDVTLICVGAPRRGSAAFIALQPRPSISYRIREHIRYCSA